MRTKHYSWKSAAPALLVVIVLGCAKPPEEEVNAARQALENARSAGAADYAPESMRQAEAAVSQLDAELQAQEHKMALTRSYQDARRLAVSARTAGEQAVADATTGKETERTKVQTLLGEAHAAIDSARALLVSAPAGKGTQVEIEAMHADLTAAQASLDEAERAYQEGSFHDALAKAEAAKSAADRIKADIDSAKALRRNGRS